MLFDELIRSLISHESRMNKYDDTPLENAFKYQLHVNIGRVRGRSSSRGRGGWISDHSDSINDLETDEKS